MAAANAASSLAPPSTPRSPRLSSASLEDPVTLFEIVAKLGEGSYGSVFKGIDKRDGKVVAIKVMAIEADDTLTALQGEINILKNCHSEHIVSYYGTYEKDNEIWIVMEYCGGGSVCDLMAICEKTLSEEQIAAVMRQSLLGIKYLHETKKIHRDIKAGNILLNDRGDCKLADFGVSAELSNKVDKRKTAIGTPYWMAPEVLQSLDYDGKADIWSLGITAIELAMGEPPHSSVHPMRAIFMIPNVDPPTLPNPSKWTNDFNDFLHVCLIKDAAQRPTALQLLTTHPFITKAKDKSIIARLVEECAQEIDDFRADEARQAAEAAEEGGADDNDNNNNEYKGTVRDFASSPSSPDHGTMVQTHKMDYPATMLLTPTIRAEGMNDTTTSSNDFAATVASTHITPSRGRGASMVSPLRKSSIGMVSSPPLPVLPQRFIYRHGRAPSSDTHVTTSIDLRASLVQLNASYNAEVTALNKFYDDRKRALQALIAQKEGRR